MKLEAIYFSENLVSIYQITRYYNPEDHKMNLHYYRKLHSHTGELHYSNSSSNIIRVITSRRIIWM
jgi:hypothetical protein